MIVYYGIIIIFIILIVIFLHIDRINIKKIKQYSKMYANISELNKKYRFIYVEREINFDYACKSKREIDNFNFEKFISLKFGENLEHYNLMFERLEDNNKKYNEYINEYFMLQIYTTEEEYAKYNDIRMKYKKFNKYEKKLYKLLKLDKPNTSIIINCHVSYTTPTKKNYYCKNQKFSFEQSKKIIKSVIEMNRELKLKKQIALKKESQIKELEKKHQERLKREEYRIKLEEERIQFEEECMSENRELLTKIKYFEYDMQLLDEKRERLDKDKLEFELATKSHIYSTDAKIGDLNGEDYKSNSSLIKKMRTLKKKLDNGEITIEEYQKQRREIM